MINNGKRCFVFEVRSSLNEDMSGVDDSRVIRTVARRILEGLDFQISEAEEARGR